VAGKRGYFWGKAERLFPAPAPKDSRYTINANAGFRGRPPERPIRSSDRDFLAYGQFQMRGVVIGELVGTR
jgi:hypothetical protein